MQLDCSSITPAHEVLRALAALEPQPREIFSIEVGTFRSGVESGFVVSFHPAKLDVQPARFSIARWGTTLPSSVVVYEVDSYTGMLDKEARKFRRLFDAPHAAAEYIVQRARLLLRPQKEVKV